MFFKAIEYSQQYIVSPTYPTNPQLFEHHQDVSFANHYHYAPPSNPSHEVRIHQEQERPLETYQTPQFESNNTPTTPAAEVVIPESTSTIPNPVEARPVPRPKRPTLAGQRVQQKKLSKPFRSPVVHTTPVRLAPKPVVGDSGQPLVSTSSSVSMQEAGPSKLAPGPINASTSKPSDAKLKHRTARASAQFKSPVVDALTPEEHASLVRLTPTIQALERKLQLLKRALKVKEEGQEEALEGLVKKWTDAGKDVAWEVWDMVKDNVQSEGSSSGGQSLQGKKRAMHDSWGWDKSGEEKKPRTEDGGTEWGDVEGPAVEEGTPADDEQGDNDDGEDGIRRATVGTMLMELGIAPETLGWNEEEEGFADADE